MSIKYSLCFLLICFLLGCSTKEKQNIETELSPIVEKINVEKIDFSSVNTERLFDNVSAGEEIIDYSYYFDQTSLIKRHINTIGLAIDPSTSEYIRRFSYSYKKAGEHEKGMRLLNLSIEAETEVGKRLNNLDYAAWNYLYFLRDYPNTIATVDKMLQLTNNDFSLSCHGEACLVLKGQALYRMKKYEEAIAVFSKFQESEKDQGFSTMDNSLLVFYKARCLAELGEYDDAIDYFLHLTKNNPHAEAAYQLAKIYHAKKEKLLAKKYLSEAQTAISGGYTFKEPYFERFDKVFAYQLDDLEEKLK